MQYYQATVTTTGEFADTLSVILIDMGSEGCSVTDYEDIKKVLAEHTWDYADEALFVKTGNEVYVNGYYPENYDFAALTEKLNELRELKYINVGSLELHVKKIDSADYENEWKKYYTPIELDKIAIVPKWLNYGGDRISVLLDPGMAFGTGNHETTRLCLKFLEKQKMEGKRCADVGCGSGILGAASLKLGAKSCYLVDIDSQAVTAAKANCALNNVLDRADICEGTLQVSKGKFDIVLANITADVLIMLRDDIYDCIIDGGSLIMSGIINSRADDVIDAYGKKFTFVKAERDGEWQGMLWQK